MLWASSDRSFAGSRIRSTIVLERRFRAHVLRRERIAFDSRFHPSTRDASGATLYIVARGSFQVEGMPPTHGPVAVVLAEHEFERRLDGADAFRSWGDPSITIELRLADEDLRIPIGRAAGPCALGERSWDAGLALADTCTTASPSDVPVVPRVRALLDALYEDGVIASDVSRCVPEVELETFTRLWDAMRPLYETNATSASIGDLKRATGLSLRQLGRDLNGLTRTFQLGDGFRDALRVLRLRAALMLLSAPDVTASQVAREVGYKSLDAMGRAFRDADLPPPRAVQDQIRSRG
jgi:AraC-like DNA-binding protein